MFSPRTAVAGIVSLAFVAMGSASQLAADSAPMIAAPTPVLLSNEVVVVGEVVSRSDQGFVVLSGGSVLVTVRVSPDTSILKGAETIRLSDLTVGDKVTVKVMRAPDGVLQAVTVDVRTGYE